MRWNLKEAGGKIILRLIRKFLRSGVSIDGVVFPTEIGTPQGGNLSPLLSNIYLNKLDKELEFDSVEEFEKFLQKKEEMEKQEKEVQPLSTIHPTSCEEEPTATFCVGATVERNPSGLIIGVSNVHSYLSGTSYSTSWTEANTEYSYGDRTGSATAHGVKHYDGVINGIPISYDEDDSFTVLF